MAQRWPRQRAPLSVAQGDPDAALPSISTAADISVVGRAAELTAVDDLVADTSSGPRVLVLEGEPGIGKTTVWRQAVERATAGGMLVLSCRAVQAEAKLAYVSLADLLAPVANEVIGGLPAPQRSALEVALLRATPAPGGVDARAVGAGVLSVLAELSVCSPVVVAIDDVQWLDRASTAALAFTLRRLQDRPVRIAVTVRLGAGAQDDPLGLDQAFGTRVERRRLGPMSLDALQHMTRERLGQRLSRPLLQRIEQVSDGNPLFALELARALFDTGIRPGAGDPFPTCGTLAVLVAERMAPLPDHSRAALLVAAALAAPTTAQIAEMLGEAAVDALEPAVAAELIEVRGQRVSFSHPLYASAIYTAASPERRRTLHRRLGELATDIEERARHLALATPCPDEGAAALLDAAATQARTRGAPGAAGELQEWAVRLTPSGRLEAMQARTLQAAEHLYRAGDLQHARQLLDGLRAEVSAGDRRARVLRLLAEIRYNEDSFAEATTLLEEALGCPPAPDAAVEILLSLAFANVNTGDVAQALSAARRALQHAEGLGKGPVLAEALAVEANVAFFAGSGLDISKVERALALEDRTRDVQMLVRPSLIAALVAMYQGRLSEAAAGLRALHEWALERGQDSDCNLLAWLSATELFRGDFAAAERIAEEMLSMAAQTRSDMMRGTALVNRGKARAFRGDVSGARDDLQQSAQLLEHTGNAVGAAWIHWALGFLELSVGDHAAAGRMYAPYVAAIESTGVPEPFAVNFLPDAIEALIGQGDLDRAERVLNMFHREDYDLTRNMVLTGATRCRALLLAAKGDVSGAQDAIEQSLDCSARTEMPFERARTLLVRGQLQRRARQKQAARVSLDHALASFEQLDARLWARATRADLRRIDHHTKPGQLTATEQRVAELAGSGCTNREIAHALFISPKTVEANIARVYRKLGIHSRAELGRTMAEQSR